MDQNLSSPVRAVRDAFPARLLGTASRMPFFRGAHAVMFHLGRCGSSVLGDLLNQHPRVFWDGEVYRRMKYNLYRELHITRDPRTLLRLRMLRAGRRLYGFEMKFLPTQHLVPQAANMSLPDFIAFLEDFGYDRFMVLKRKNYLRQTVSKQVGTQTGKWAVSSRDSTKLNTVTIDVKNCARFGYEGMSLVENFDMLDAAYADLDRLLQGHSVLHLSYEDDLLPDPIKGYQEACRYLGLPEHETVQVTRNRQNPYPLHRIVDNIEEVERALRGTAYEWMLHE